MKRGRDDVDHDTIESPRKYYHLDDWSQRAWVHAVNPWSIHDLSQRISELTLDDGVYEGPGYIELCDVFYDVDGIQ